MSEDRCITVFFDDNKWQKKFTWIILDPFQILNVQTWIVWYFDYQIHTRVKLSTYWRKVLLVSKTWYLDFNSNFLRSQRTDIDSTIALYAQISHNYNEIIHRQKQLYREYTFNRGIKRNQSRIKNNTQIM